MSLVQLEVFRKRCRWEAKSFDDEPGHVDWSLHIDDCERPEFGLVCVDATRTHIVWDWGLKQNFADSADEGKRFLERVAYTDEIAEKAKDKAWEALRD